MSAPSYAVLAAEVANDPLGLGYAGQTDAGVAAIMNALTQTLVVPQVPMSQVLTWAAAGPLDAVYSGQTAQADAGGIPAATIRSICRAAIQMFGTLSVLDLSLVAVNNASPTAPGMVQLLTTAGIIASAQATALLALQNVPTSRALSLPGWGVSVQAPDILAVRGN